MENRFRCVASSLFDEIKVAFRSSALSGVDFFFPGTCPVFRRVQRLKTTTNYFGCRSANYLSIISFHVKDRAFPLCKKTAVVPTKSEERERGKKKYPASLIQFVSLGSFSGSCTSYLAVWCLDLTAPGPNH